MSHPNQTPQHVLRRWAPTIVPGVRSTHNLQVVATWMAGTHSADHDMPPKHLERFLRGAMEKLITWKETEGYQFLYHPPDYWRPPNGWYRHGSNSFWWMGPVEATVIGKYVYVGDEDEPDFTGRKGPWPSAPHRRVGEANLEQTGGKVAYRVGGFWTVREHLQEIPKNLPLRGGNSETAD